MMTTRVLSVGGNSGKQLILRSFNSSQFRRLSSSANSHHSDADHHSEGGDHSHHSHPLFHPPYDFEPKFWFLFCVLGGTLTVASLVSYGQWKGGYWFKKKQTEQK